MGMAGALMGARRGTLQQRFWSKVDRGGDCWLWTAARSPLGYGKISVGRSGEGVELAHRVSWEIHFGPVPDGMCVLHRCDNPPCVRPDHLFLGDRADNAADSAAKGRTRSGESNHNAKLSSSSVALIRSRVAGGESNTSVARDFGITQSAVSMIVNRRRWGRVA